MHIIGNGLIAKAFKKNYFNNDCIIFASGVSNSKNDNNLDFYREINLIEEALNKFKNKHIIYFSTCSLNNNEISKYKDHKKKIESYIVENCLSYSIFRLPQVVGIVNNQTLISALIRNLKYGHEIMIHSKTTRHLLDVQDIPRISNIILKKGFSNSIIDIAPSLNVDIYSIVKFIAFELGLDYKVNLINEGFEQNIFISTLESVLSSNDNIFKEDYWKLVLKKYTKKIYQIV